MKKARDKRGFDRIKLRIQCEIQFNGESCPGTVLDISPSGIFVRMSPSSAPPTSTEARVLLKDTPHGDMILLARVMRAKTVRRELMAAAGGGVGLQIYSAPESYYKLLAARISAGSAF